VTGGAGMLGSQVLRTVPDDLTGVGTDLREAPGVESVGVDVADEAAVARLFEAHGPFTGVIHTAAYTEVDRAEDEEKLAMRVNADACGVIAAACAGAGIPLVVVGTDFVFDGRNDRPYTEADATNPLSAYARTKLEGERQAFAAHPAGTRVVRTQWLYGPRGKHFPATILRLAAERKSLQVVADQVGSPTSTLELAPALWDVLCHGEAGVYHATCEGQCSWYDLAVAVVEARGIVDVEVQPCSTADFPRPAVRPAYSVLDCSRLTALRGRPMADWRDALKSYLESEEE